ncbi:AMP-binding protein [Glaciimonas sp. PCH181]|uniref:AMP-binding protein n=1 Tax=Glaciimonas sp. PCH181 TaxID=2133943 RepID=UPI000D36182C|nr:AMP-binding protein [Glaciimonas sp. PCH181]PUA19796.1 AMP-binding protein [Glaciimonas sp. PCH181]
MANSCDLLSLLKIRSNSDPARPFAWRDGATLDHAYFFAQVNAWRTLFLRQPGSCFALFLTDSVTFSCALLGAWQADKTIYLPGDVLPVTCVNLARVVHGFVGEFPLEYAPLMLVSSTLSTAHSVDYKFKALEPDFPGVVIYTSGSTGAPQAVAKKLSQLSTEVATLENLFGERIGQADIIATVSHQHIYGMLFKVLWPLATGRILHARHIEFLEELSPLLYRIAQAGDRSAILISSPAHLKRIPTTMQPTLLGGLRAIFSSGGPLSQDVAVEAGRLLGHVPIEVYGSSETGGIGWRQRAFGGAAVDESWRVMPGIVWRIAPDDAVLEICSPHLPDAQWFSLADQAQAIDAAHFLLQGRIDRIVKVEEKRISLDAIEGQLKASHLVADVRVLLLDSSEHQRRQQIAAFVVLSDAGRILLDEEGKLTLNRRLRDDIAPAVERIALPRCWRYLDALPMNAQGKTTRADLLALTPHFPLADNAVKATELTVTLPVTRPYKRVLEMNPAQSRVVLELTVPRELLYFKGHFDGAPILPGVVQVDWAIAYGREYFKLAPHFLSMHALKFQRVVMPEAVLQLALQHDTQKSSLTFRLTSSAGQHASGRIVFGNSDE